MPCWARPSLSCVAGSSAGLNLKPAETLPIEASLEVLLERDRVVGDDDVHVGRQMSKLAYLRGNSRAVLLDQQSGQGGAPDLSAMLSCVQAMSPTNKNRAPLAEQALARTEVVALVLLKRASGHLQIDPRRQKHECLRLDMRRGLYREMSARGVAHENQRGALKFAAGGHRVFELCRPDVLGGEPVFHTDDFERRGKGQMGAKVRVRRRGRSVDIGAAVKEDDSRPSRFGGREAADGHSADNGVAHVHSSQMRMRIRFGGDDGSLTRQGPAGSLVPVAPERAYHPLEHERPGGAQWAATQPGGQCWQECNEKESERAEHRIHKCICGSSRVHAARAKKAGFGRQPAENLRANDGARSDAPRRARQAD